MKLATFVHFLHSWKFNILSCALFLTEELLSHNFAVWSSAHGRFFSSLFLFSRFASFSHVFLFGLVPLALLMPALALA